MRACFLADPFTEVEVLDDGLHVRPRRLPQRNLAALRQSFALTLADFLALERNRLHALGQRVGRHVGHRQRQHRRRRGDRRKHHGEEVRVEPLGDLLHHGFSQKSKLIILRITSTPIPIQMAQPANIACPSGSVNRIEM